MRAKQSTKIELQPDPVYKSRLVTRLINRVMRDGKKSAAQTQVYKAFTLLAEKTSKDALEVFTESLENIKPQMEVKARRIGGAAYQVPTPVRGDRREALGLRWLITASRARPSREYHTFAEKLVAELIDAQTNLGAAVKKKLDTHRMAEANKAFAHFRW
ncbi:MAG: 30S ribosomal protein S7 [Candidatus Amesbacteria bacterium]|nr:30S ribosomal protein S7 [Candidatus Amesbacteria bacterium]